MADKTSYTQSLMHMIKGNLGTGILAMPASFAHAGLVSSIIGLPILCLIATYCVHLLIRSSQQLEARSKGSNFNYAELAKQAFNSGPNWVRTFSKPMCLLVDGILLVAQIGVCSVYLVFVVENIITILKSYEIEISKNRAFIAILPVALLLSYIKTLERLAIASAFANLIQALGISLILEYLSRDIHTVDLSQRDKFKPLSEVALGFGSAMFAFEGISVVLPVYTRMKNRNQMSGCLGVANISYGILLILYFAVGVFGYLKFGSHVKDSITLNLPPEPIYDGVRGMFAVSVFLTYPLQFYVPNEIVWNWVKKNLLSLTNTTHISNGHNNSEIVIPAIQITAKTSEETCGGQIICDKKENQFSRVETHSNLVEKEGRIDRYEYLCRTSLVAISFMIAMTVPKLNLLMDLIGSISGTLLSLIIPAIIHLASFWDDAKGFQKMALILIDSTIIVFGLAAGASGSISSLSFIVRSFDNK